MPTPVGINGFSSVGQAFFFATLTDPTVDVRVINEPCMSAECIKYIIENAASRYAPRVDVTVTAIDGNNLVINDNQTICVLGSSDTRSSQWKQYGVQYVVECTGFNTTRDRCWGHITGGATGVVIAASSADATSILPTLHDGTALSAALPVCAAGSSIAAVVATILSAVQSTGLVEDVSYTAVCGPQSICGAAGNSSDPRDWREARQLASQGSAVVPGRQNGLSTLQRLFPQLGRNITARTLQVASVQGCAIDLVLRTANPTTPEMLNAAIANLASAHPTVVAVCTAANPLISTDCLGKSTLFYDTGSSSSSTDGRRHQLLVWVDLECHYAAQLLSIVKQAAALNKSRQTSQDVR